MPDPTLIGVRTDDPVILLAAVMDDDSLVENTVVAAALTDTEVDGRGVIEVELALIELALVALPTRLELEELGLTEMALASLFVDSDDRTDSTELVAVNEPVVILGTVPARLTNSIGHD